MKEKLLDDKIIIYGTNQQAAALYTMILKENKGIVEGFVVDKEFKKAETFMGLPVHVFDDIETYYPPQIYQICLSFGYKNMVYNRREKYNLCKKRGYRLYTYISSNAILYTDQVDEGCCIYPGTILMPSVKVGKGSFIEAGTIVAHNTEIGDFNFIAPGVHFCGTIKTGDNCFFGGAAEIANNCIIGNECFIAAAAKVSRNLSDGEVVLPAKGSTTAKSAFEMMEYMFRGL